MAHRYQSRQSRQTLAHPRTQPAAGRQILAYNLKKWRAVRHLSQEALAELSGLSRGFVSLIENARRNVSLDNICQIAAALAIHPRRLLDDEEDGA